MLPPVSPPRILVTVDVGEQFRGDVGFPAWSLKRAYTDAVLEAGGLPLLAVPGADPGALAHVADGLVVTGGAFDLPPEMSGADPAGRIDPPRPERTSLELGLLRAMRPTGRPVLGICGGMQLLAVFFGARLIGDLRTAGSDFGEHEPPSDPRIPSHGVRLAEPTWLAERLGRGRIAVNSTHHQGVLTLPGPLRALGWAEDGLVEAVDDGTPDWVGVQWHPELLADDVSRVLYANLVDRARRIRAARDRPGPS